MESVVAIIPYSRAGHKAFKTGPECFYCGRQTVYIPDASKPYAKTRDHVFAKHLRHGNKLASGLTVPCCQACNRAKGRQRPGNFIMNHIVESRWPLIDWPKLLEMQARTGLNIGWVPPEVIK